MGFVDLESMQPIEPVSGCRLRTPNGQHLMRSYFQMDADAEIPMHHHPHEQAGILVSGKLRLTIGDETRLVEPGSLFIIPPKVPHQAPQNRPPLPRSIPAWTFAGRQTIRSQKSMTSRGRLMGNFWR